MHAGRLFGDGGSSAERLADLRKNSSLLDWMREDIGRLQKKLGPNDRTKVNQYLDTVREVERRIQKAEAETADTCPAPCSFWPITGRRSRSGIARTSRAGPP